MHKIYSMKKLILFLLISPVIFAQNLSKEQLIENISKRTCACIAEKEITKDNLEVSLGLCMIQDFSKYEKDIETYYGKNGISNESKMELLAKDIGIELASNCPIFVTILSENIDDLEKVEKSIQDELFVIGMFGEFKSEQFITFSVKENSGKSNNFILLNDFDNAFLITDNILKNNDLVQIYYYELELYDAKIKKFVTYKIVSEIIKK